MLTGTTVPFNKGDEFLQVSKRSLDNVAKMFEQQDRDALIPEWLYIREETGSFFSR